MSTNVGGAKKPVKKTKKPVKKPVKRTGGRGYTYASFEADKEVVGSVQSTPSVPSITAIEPAELVDPIDAIASSDPTMDGGAKKKKQKVKRKPGQYALFVKKNYSNVAKAHPKWKATDCIKEIAKMWREQKK